MNSKDNETIDRFIQLRAQGGTFARIAAKLNVSTRTLIHWSRQHQHRIQISP
jgi:transposase-like protein